MRRRGEGGGGERNMNLMHDVVSTAYVVCTNSYHDDCALCTTIISTYRRRRRKKKNCSPKQKIFRSQPVDKANPFNQIPRWYCALCDFRLCLQPLFFLHSPFLARTRLHASASLPPPSASFSVRKILLLLLYPVLLCTVSTLSQSIEESMVMLCRRRRTTPCHFHFYKHTHTSLHANRHPVHTVCRMMYARTKKCQRASFQSDKFYAY